MEKHVRNDSAIWLILNGAFKNQKRPFKEHSFLVQTTPVLHGWTNTFVATSLLGLGLFTTLLLHRNEGFIQLLSYDNKKVNKRMAYVLLGLLLALVLVSFDFEF